MIDKEGIKKHEQMDNSKFIITTQVITVVVFSTIIITGYLIFNGG